MRSSPPDAALVSSRDRLLPGLRTHAPPGLGCGRGRQRGRRPTHLAVAGSEHLPRPGHGGHRAPPELGHGGRDHKNSDPRRRPGSQERSVSRSTSEPGHLSFSFFDFREGEMGGWLLWIRLCLFHLSPRFYLFIISFLSIFTPSASRSLTLENVKWAV